MGPPRVAPAIAPWSSGEAFSSNRRLRYLLAIGVLSLAGAFVVPLSVLGRTTPASVSRDWLLLLAVAWIGLFLWALLFALGRHLLAREPVNRALRQAAIGHSPLFLCIPLIVGIYLSDGFNHAYSVNSPYGELVLQPVARGYLIALPLMVQLLHWLGLRWRSFLAVLPVASVSVIALGLRLWNVNWDLPAQLHPDEYQYTGRAWVMVVSGDLNPHYFKNPSLMIYLVNRIYTLLWQKDQLFYVVADLFGMTVQDPQGIYLRLLAARSLGAVAGALTVPTIYSAGKELFGRRAALVGAALLAVSFLHVRDSHFATNDVLATFLLSLSFLFSVRVWKRGRPVDYLLSGLLGGLGTSAKYSAGFFFLALLVAHLARMRDEASRPSLSHHLPLLLSGLVAAVGFFAGTPYALLDFPTFVSDFTAQYDLGSSVWTGQQAGFAPFLFAVALVQGLGLLPLALSAAGLCLAPKGARLPLALVLAVPAGYSLFMATQQLFFARFAVPLLPYLAIVSGYGTVRTTELLRRVPMQGAALFLGVAALAQPVFMASQSDLLLGRPDTRVLAAEWIQQHTPPASTVAVEYFAHVDADKLRIERWYQYAGRQAHVFWSDTEEQRAKAISGAYDYVVVSSFAYEPRKAVGSEPSSLPVEYAALAGKGQLVARFGPGSHNSDVPYSQDDMYTPFWQLFNRERPGPTVLVYSTKQH